jgi:hypothetical protein
MAPSRWTIGDNPVLQMKAGVGIEGYYSELPGDVEVQSDGNIFDTKASKQEGIKYTLRVLKAPTNVKKDGLPVKVTFREPRSGQQKQKTIIIMPKKK